MTQFMDCTKQPWEVFAIGMEFKNNMDEGELIEPLKSIVVIYEYATNEDVTADLIEGSEFVSSDTILLAVLKGGVSDTKYKASFRAYISDNKKLEEDLIFTVRD